MRKTTVATLSAVGLISLFSMSVQAQTVAGALQLGLGTDFVSYSNYTQRVTVPAVPAALGTVDQKYDLHQTRWGVSDRSNLNLEVGYGLNDEMIIGGMLVLGGWTGSVHSQQQASPQQVKQSNFNFFIGPKFDYMFLPDSRVRPFIGAVVGLSRVAQNNTNTTQFGVTTTSLDTGYTGVGLMGRAGIRWFLTPGFSLDPAFVFGFSSMTGSAQGVAVGPGPNGALSYDSGLTGFSVGLGVTASGWVGL
jgi:outer membrane protein W